MTNYNTLLNRFINSDEFAEEIIKSSKPKTPFSGSYYMVELLPDETCRVLWFRVADDSPVTTGVRLGIPQLSPQEFQELKEEVGTDDTQEMAEALRKKDIVNKKADILRNNLKMVGF
ncbi:MAG TPA: hypothetical protein VF974_06095 [Patescibacteria group bacterium]